MYESLVLPVHENKFTLHAPREDRYARLFRELAPFLSSARAIYRVRQRGSEKEREKGRVTRRKEEKEREGELADRKKGSRAEKKRGEESGRNRSAWRDREANGEGPFLPLERRLQKRLGERSNGHVTSRTTRQRANVQRFSTWRRKRRRRERL